MIKIRIEAKPEQLEKMIGFLLSHFHDSDVTGLYEISKKRSRAYMDINFINE